MENVKKQNWPEIRDCEGVIIDIDDILVNGNYPGYQYIVASLDTLEEIGDGSVWRAVDYLHEGEDLENALIRIENEISR